MSPAALALGTAQLGIPGYGIAAEGGLPPRAEAARMIAAAPALGFRAVDTAPHYGDAEELVGRHLPRAADAPVAHVARTPAYLDRLGPEAAARAVREGFERTLARLHTDRVHALLVHVAADLLGEAGPAVFAELERIRGDGRAARIGCAAYGGEELDRLSARFPLEVVQVPLSVLDQRILASGHLERLAADGVEVHARSVFAQGLVLSDPDGLPAGMEPAREPIARVREHAARSGRTPLELALGFVLARTEVAFASVGARSLAELEEIAGASRRAADGDPETAGAEVLAAADPFVVDPTRWPNAEVGR